MTRWTAFWVPRANTLSHLVNKSKSSTFLEASQKLTYFSTSSADGIYATGSNGTDTLRVGDVELERFPMGVVDSTAVWVGVLGLGDNSSSYERYNNFPDRLLQSGQINSKAYSISLDDPEAGSGSLLLGAIDTSRYEGELVRVSASATYAYYSTFGVEVTGFNGSSDSNTELEELAWNELPFDATIGPGELFSNLPYRIASKMYEMSGATYNDTVQAAVIPCDAAGGKDDDKARFKIQLVGPDGPVLDVHLSDLIIPASVTTGTDYWYYMADVPDLCLFGVRNITDGDGAGSYSYYNLGSSLLRRSYMVFDIPNAEVALAPAKFTDRGDPTVVEFASYGAPAPSATLYCGAVPTGYSYNCDPHSSNYPGGSGSGSGGSGRSGSSSNSIASRNGAIGVGVAFGLIALIGAVAAIMAWKRVCCGPRDKSGKGLESGTDVESVPATATAAATAAQGQHNSVVSPGQQQLPTISESEMAEAQRLPPLPPRSISPPSPDQDATSAAGPVTDRSPSSSAEGETSGAREVGEQPEPPHAVDGDEQQREMPVTAQDKGKGVATGTADS